MFFKHQSETDFAVIKKIVWAINSDLSDDEILELINKSLRQSGMIEEGYKPEEEKDESNSKKEKPDIVMHAGTREFLAVTDEFKIKIEDRIYHMVFYVN